MNTNSLTHTLSFCFCYRSVLFIYTKDQFDYANRETIPLNKKGSKIGTFFIFFLLFPLRNFTAYLFKPVLSLHNNFFVHFYTVF